METVADLNAVQEAMRALEEQGEKITSRKVQAITGGSMTTVLRLFREAQQDWKAARPSPQRSLPQALAETILAYVGGEVAASSQALEAELQATSAREKEALEALELAEQRIAALQADLMQCLREMDQGRMEAERAQAASSNEIEGLRIQVGGLQTERRQLIEAGEASRLAAAKAELKVERADLATTKAEELAAALATKSQALQDEKTAQEKLLAAAEQRAAIAEQRFQDFCDQAKRAEIAATSQLIELKSATEKETRALCDRIQAADLATSKADARAKKLEIEINKLRSHGSKGTQKKGD